jgi:Pyruvate/2-oxoglutarate dehydrogenase complex, dihydrolipoamide acyltransferase (E2) component, and related enzymes
MAKHAAEVAEIVMPQLAESVVDATISKWLKRPGDRVEEYEPLCEIVTDKVTAELPSTAAGVLLEIRVREGETVGVGTVICTVGDVQAQEPGASFGSAGDDDFGAGTGTERNAPDMRARYSPAVRMLAAEHGIDLRRLTGTGFGGRITRKDVLKAIEAGAGARDGEPRNTGTPFAPGSRDFSTGRAPSQRPDAVQAGNASGRSIEELPVEKLPVRSTGLHLSPPAVPPIPEDATEGRNEYLIDVTPVRSTIASRMRQSVTEIPHAWMMVEVDVTNLVALRNKLKDEFMKREGFNLTYLAFVLKAVVNAIKDYPIVNSVWAVDKIIVKRDINISLAIGTEDAVYTPVIKDADRKNIAGLAREIDTLTKKARSGKLTPADMQGGTITVNNTGSFGSILSQPIINYPQAVNLTFEAIVKRPVVIGDMIGVRSMANMCLSLDHRILDGVICGRFLQRVKENIEAYQLDTAIY